MEHVAFKFLFRFGEISLFHRIICASKVQGALQKLIDAGAAADTLIINFRLGI